eukprot:687362-Lingulodinium_polyedra.AAC.1
MARSVKQAVALFCRLLFVHGVACHFQDEEDQRAAIARFGSDSPTNALHAWLVVGCPTTIPLT